MILSILDIPDEPAQLPAWLERQLIAPRLDVLIRQLQIVHGQENGTNITLRALLGEWLDHVLAGGLKLLPPEVLQRLLTHPARLLDLQEAIFAEGGSYWDSLVSADAEIDAQVQRSRQRLDPLAPRQPASPPLDEDPPTLRFQPRRGRSHSLGLFLAGAAVAASLLLLVGAIFLQRFQAPPASPPAIAWGWAKPGTLDRPGSPSQYLNHLASAAEEWFKKRPEDAEAVAHRLLEFRAGCSDLILAQHEPLSTEDRTWLRQRCQLWAEKIDTYLTLAESGQPLEAREQADQTVRKLVTVLRDRAARLRT